MIPDEQSNAHPGLSTDESRSIVKAGNIEKARASLLSRLIETDEQALWREFSVSSREGFIEEFLDEVNRCRRPDAPAVRLSADITPVVERVLKDGLGIRRFDEITRTSGWMFATEQEHGRVFRLFGAASHAQLVDALLVDVTALLDIAPPVPPTTSALAALLSQRRRELEAMAKPTAAQS